MTATTAAALSTFCAFASRVPPDDTPKKAEARADAHLRCKRSTFAREACTCTCHQPTTDSTDTDQGEPAMATLSDLERTDRTSDNGTRRKTRRTDEEKRAIIKRYDAAETKADREKVLNDHGGIHASNISTWRRALGLPAAPRRTREAPPERKARKPRKAGKARKPRKKRAKKAAAVPAEPAPVVPETECWLGDYVSVALDARDRNVLDALAFLGGTVPDQLISDLISGLVNEHEGDTEVTQLIALRAKRRA